MMNNEKKTEFQAITTTAEHADQGSGEESRGAATRSLCDGGRHSRGGTCGSKDPECLLSTCRPDIYS